MPTDNQDPGRASGYSVREEPDGGFTASRLRDSLGGTEPRGPRDATVFSVSHLPSDAAHELPPSRADEAFWRPSNQMGVRNTDLAKQLEATTMGARLWRLQPGQASTRHRHRAAHELYVLLEGRGRIRIEDELLTLDPMSVLLVAPDAVRQLFNDTGDEQLWLVVGAPREAANTLEMTDEDLAWLYPDGPKALPPELTD